jgi:hypothetical protein
LRHLIERSHFLYNFFTSVPGLAFVRAIDADAGSALD